MRRERPSPWGPMRVVDGHVHFFSHRFFSTIIAQKPGLTWDAAKETLAWEMPPEDPEKLAARWIAELDQQSIESAAIIASVPGDEASVVAAAYANPDRFFAYAMVNPKSPQAPVLGAVRAACLFPAMHLYSIQDDCCRPIFEWAQREKRAVFVHCGMLSVGVRAKLGLPSLFDMRYSNPVDLQAVALKYPDVPIIIPHFGAGYFREALMVATLCPNVYLDTSSSNDWTRMQVPPISVRGSFRQALRVLGPHRLLFGTDSSFFPRGWQSPIFEAQAAALHELGTSSADAQLIFADNLLRILSR